MGQLWFATTAAAFAVGAVYFILLGLKEFNAAMKEYSKSLDRDENYNKLTYLRVNNLKSIGLFLRAATLLLAAGITIDVYRGNFFYTCMAAIILIVLVVARQSERKYRRCLKDELGIK